MPDRETVGLIGLGVLFLLLALRIPVGLAMVLTAITRCPMSPASCASSHI